MCLEHMLGEAVDLHDSILSVMVALSRDAASLQVSQWDTVKIYLPFEKGSAPKRAGVMLIW